MAHIAYVTNGMSSTLNSSLELSRRLVEAGHRVTYLSHRDLGEVASAHGHGWMGLDTEEVWHREIEALRPPWKSGEWRPGRWARWIRRRRELRARSARAEGFAAALQELDPDLVIVDMELHVAVMVAVSLGLPVMLAIVWFSVFHAPGLPPMNSKLLPGDGWTHDLRVRWAWARTRLERGWLEWRARLGTHGGARPLGAIRFDTHNVDDLGAVARARGFDQARGVSRRDWLRPWVYPELPILAFNLWELEFPHRPHPNLHYVGPMVARERRELRTDPASRGALDELLERRRRHPDRPLIYCSLGSYWSADRELLSKVVEAVRREPEWDLVLGLGGKLTAEDLAPLPDNVTALAWAPQLEVLSHASACITHGGITSINECIAFEVPMVVFSTEYVDQDGCAARVEYHGVGLRTERARATAAGIQAQLRTVLTDPDIQGRVQALRRRLEEVERERPAVRLIEEHLARDARAGKP